MIFENAFEMKNLLKKRWKVVKKEGRLESNLDVWNKDSDVKRIWNAKVNLMKEKNEISSFEIWSRIFLFEFVNEENLGNDEKKKKKRKKIDFEELRKYFREELVEWEDDLKEKKNLKY